MARISSYLPDASHVIHALCARHSRSPHVTLCHNISQTLFHHFPPLLLFILLHLLLLSFYSMLGFGRIIRLDPAVLFRTVVGVGRGWGGGERGFLGGRCLNGFFEDSREAESRQGFFEGIFFFENFQEDSSGILGWMSRMVQDGSGLFRIIGIVRGSSKDFWVD